MTLTFSCKIVHQDLTAVTAVSLTADTVPASTAPQSDIDVHVCVQVSALTSQISHSRALPLSKPAFSNCKAVDLL